LFVDLDSIKDTDRGFEFKSKRYEPTNKHSSDKTGFFYQRHLLRGGSSVSQHDEMIQVYDWRTDKWFPWQYTDTVSNDQFIQLRFLLMEMCRAEGKTGWPDLSKRGR